jgi:hypothetical protein
MSKNQEQMKELINDVRTGKTDKEVLCKEIQKDVNCLIYPVFGEDYKKLSPRAIIDICTNLDSIDVNKNIMRQIATRVSVFMFNLIDNSTIKIDDDYEYEYGRIKEDKELFDIIKDNSRIFKDFKAYDNAPDNIKSLSRVQTIMMELYGYEMHSVDEIETLLDIDSAFILKLIAMMKDNILGISSVVENMSDYASFDEKETDDSDIKIYGAEQKAAETEAADEYEAYEPENADLPDGLSVLSSPPDGLSVLSSPPDEVLSLSFLPAGLLFLSSAIVLSLAAVVSSLLLVLSAAEVRDECAAVELSLLVAVSLGALVVYSIGFHSLLLFLLLAFLLLPPAIAAIDTIRIITTRITTIDAYTTLRLLALGTPGNTLPTNAVSLSISETPLTGTSSKSLSSYPFMSYSNNTPSSESSSSDSSFSIPSSDSLSGKSAFSGS